MKRIILYSHYDMTLEEVTCMRLRHAGAYEYFSREINRTTKVARCERPLREKACHYGARTPTVLVSDAGK